MNMEPKDFRRNKAKFFLFVPLILALVSTIVMMLWNNILPELLGVKHITFWQSAGLLVLCKILFGGFGFAKNQGGPGAQFREKWMMHRMSGEDRQKVREEWLKRCRQWKKED
ncbi:hypothetical protein ACFP1I_10375 [Dyadobacter subterraneus]|uniref:Uncharacterized protein n=1 Tax=Dyadobacter subterraneus TaxID=2773304 RepID=A0ABR9WBF9_9BACT|nr:hypothetical protein [Dyadobacter subterraneus]MBE9462489.1 hypothetical protein [Dyadobacter subterraneus]